jgi:CRP-like cAMP-binding protein
VIPPWLELKMTGLAKTRSSSSATDVDSNETFQDQLESTVSKLFGDATGQARNRAQRETQKTALTLFGIAPHNRVEEDIRVGAMWLRGTSLGNSLPPLARQNIVRGAKLLKVQSGNILSAEVMTRNRVEPPPHVFVVLSGMLIQRCKHRSFQRFLMRGDVACELPLLDQAQFGHDIVTVAGGPSGATVVSIPRQLFLGVARSHRYRILMDRIQVLQSSPLFDGMSRSQLARLALALRTQRIPRGARVVEQGGGVEALYVVSRGEFSCGRSLPQRGANMLPQDTVALAAVDRSVLKQTKWVRVKRELRPTTTVGQRKTRGDFFGAEAVYSSISGVLDTAELKSLSGLLPGTEAGERFDASAWSTVICSGAGEVFEITCPMLKMLGKELFRKLVCRVAAAVAKRPKDSTLMRRMTMRQEIQRLKSRLLQSSCTI